MVSLCGSDGKRSGEDSRRHRRPEALPLRELYRAPPLRSRLKVPIRRKPRPVVFLVATRRFSAPVLAHQDAHFRAPPAPVRAVIQRVQVGRRVPRVRLLVAEKRWVWGRRRGGGQVASSLEVVGGRCAALSVVLRAVRHPRMPPSGCTAVQDRASRESSEERKREVPVVEERRRSLCGALAVYQARPRCVRLSRRWWASRRGTSRELCLLDRFTTVTARELRPEMLRRSIVSPTKALRGRSSSAGSRCRVPPPRLRRALMEAW